MKKSLSLAWSGTNHSRSLTNWPRYTRCLIVRRSDTTRTGILVSRGLTTCNLAVNSQVEWIFIWNPEQTLDICSNSRDSRLSGHSLIIKILWDRALTTWWPKVPLGGHRRRHFWRSSLDSGGQMQIAGAAWMKHRPRQLLSTNLKGTKK